MLNFAEFRRLTRTARIIDVRLLHELDAIDLALAEWAVPQSHIHQIAACLRIEAACRVHIERVLPPRDAGMNSLHILRLFRECHAELKRLKGRRQWKSLFAKLGAMTPEQINQATGAQLPRPLGPAIQKLHTLDNLSKVQEIAKLVAVPKVHVDQAVVPAQAMQPEVWRELFDPRHRTGWSAAGPYREWLAKINEESPEYDPSVRESFFAYLDRVDDPSNRQVVGFLDQIARDALEVRVLSGTLYGRGADSVVRAYSTAGLGVNDRPKIDRGDFIRWANWVMSPDKRVYSSAAFQFHLDKDGKVWRVYIHHSSFLDGGPILCGGEWSVVNGAIREINCASGHYRPTGRQFQAALHVFLEMGVSLDQAVVEWSMLGKDHYFLATDIARPNTRLEFGHWPVTIGSQQPLVEVDRVTRQPLAARAQQVAPAAHALPAGPQGQPRLPAQMAAAAAAAPLQAHPPNQPPQPAQAAPPVQAAPAQAVPATDSPYGGSPH